MLAQAPPFVEALSAVCSARPAELPCHLDDASIARLRMKGMGALAILPSWKSVSLLVIRVCFSWRDEYLNKLNGKKTPDKKYISEKN